MIGRLLWRAFIGLIAVGLAYGTVFLFYPYLRDYLSILSTLIILYLFTAYIGIPLLVRLWYLVITPKHLPHYAVSGDGWSSDPVNIAVVCRNRRHLTREMKRAGWHVADKITLASSLRLGYAIIFNQPYSTAPFSNLYLFGRKQDVGFQIQTGSPPTPRHRHHVRFWQLRINDNVDHHHETFWHKITAKLFSGGTKEIWIGTGTHDVGPFALRIRNLQLTHQIDENTDTERDYIISTLKQAKSIKKTDVIPAGEPIKFKGQTFGVQIVTDGKLHVVQLRR